MSGPVSSTARRVRVRRGLQVLADPARRAVLHLQRRDGPRVLVISIPKSGTHLLTGVLDSLDRIVPYRHGVRRPSPDGLRRMVGSLAPGTYLATHLSHDEERADAVAAAGLRVVVLVRDPRDIVCSMVRFAVRTPYVPEHGLYQSIPSHDERLRVAIAGDERRGEPPRLLHRMTSARRWADDGALLLRYEDLVGERGGGSQQAQQQAIRRLTDHLGLDLDAAALERVAADAYDTSSRTFSRGRAGAWREELTAEHLELLQRTVGDVAADLGYSLDDEAERRTP